MSDAEVTIAPVDQSNWADLESLFEQKGGPHYCWCMLWRPMAAKDRGNKTAKKRELRSRISEGVPIGLLAYSGGVPIGWCSVAPQRTLRRLHEGQLEKDGNRVWSITCFFVARSFRGKGVTDALIGAAVAYARSNGARSVEAYPVARGSPTYRFMGIVDQFERAGFTLSGRAGSRRSVMQRKIA